MAENPTSITQTTDTKNNPLEQFCDGVKAYADALVDTARRQLEGEDHADDVIDSGSTFRSQLHNIVDEMRSGYSRASPDIQSAVIDFARVTSAAGHAAAAAKSIAKGFMCKIIEFLQGHLKEIKKIIGAILDMLGMALLNWPKVSALFNEIFDIIAAIFCPDAAAKLSRSTQNYYLQLAAVCKFDSAYRRSDLVEDE